MDIVFKSFLNQYYKVAVQFCSSPLCAIVVCTSGRQVLMMKEQLSRWGTTLQTIEFDVIAVVRSDYQQKFAIPRQPNLATAARAWLDVDAGWVERGALQGLESASHLWLQFVFHAVPTGTAKGRVRPPRLGGNERVGVFATRATHRPNPIGLSVVRLLAVEGARVYIAGADLLDGTPVLDIKPYLPWCDSVPEATHAFAGESPEILQVLFSVRAEQGLASIGPEQRPRIKQLLEQSLGQDPRPAYQRGDAERVYGVRIADCEVRWQHPQAGVVEVLSIDYIRP